MQSSNPVTTTTIATPTSVTNIPTLTNAKLVSLPAELATAGLTALVTAIGTFTGSLTFVTSSDTKSVAAAGLAAGIAALASFGNSLKVWLQQKSGG